MHDRFGLALAAGVAAWGLAASPAAADESPFNTVYTTDTLPAGASEIEQWATWRSGRPHESYRTLEGRTEYEYGVTNDFQLSGYANYAWRHEIPGESHARFTGVSAEAVYRIWDVYTHPLGVALYLEPAIGPGSREIEAKLLLQKNFLDDRLVLAANAVLEDEWSHADADPAAAPASPDAFAHWGTNTELKLLVGASYRFAPNWSAGAEFEAKREFDGLLIWEHSAAAADSFFIGPTLHYANADYFVTFGIQAQLPWAANLSGEPGETVGGFAHEEERVRAQLRIGIEL
jgi:hypothetical protein